MRTVMLVALLGIGASAFAQEQPNELLTERELREACSFDAAGVRECLATQVKESEATLKAAESAFANAVDHWDTDAKSAKQTRQKLSAAAAAFVKYRAAQCAWAASLGGGAIGHALEMRRLACVAELNLRRADSLQTAARELHP